MPKLKTGCEIYQFPLELERTSLQQNEKKNESTHAGGEEIEVEIGWEKRNIFVRQLSTRELVTLANVIADNDGLGDEAAMLVLYAGKDRAAELATAGRDAIREVLNKGEELNLPCLQKLLVGYRRRAALFGDLAQDVLPPNLAEFEALVAARVEVAPSGLSPNLAESEEEE